MLEYIFFFANTLRDLCVAALINVKRAMNIRLCVSPLKLLALITFRCHFIVALGRVKMHRREN